MLSNMVYCLFFCNGPGSQTAKLVIFQNKIQDEVSFGVGWGDGGGVSENKKGPFALHVTQTCDPAAAFLI